MFTKDKILSDNEIIAQQLRGARSAKKLKLKEISARINVNQKYLKALERGEFNKLPSGIYGKNFLKEYAIFLGLDHKDLTKLYQVNNDESALDANQPGKNKKTAYFSKQVIKGRNFLVFSKIVKGIIIVLIVAVCFTYLGLCLNKIVSEPEITIVEPPDNLVTKDNFINIIGTTNSEVQVTINGEAVTLLEDKGGIYFSKKINLKSGVNTVIIVAKKKYSRETIIKKQILLDSN